MPPASSSRVTITQLTPDNTGNISNCLSAHSTWKLAPTRSQLRESLPIIETSAVMVWPVKNCGNFRHFCRKNRKKPEAGRLIHLGGQWGTVEGLGWRVRGEVLREAAGQLFEAGADAFLQRLHHRLYALLRDRLVAVVAFVPHDVSGFHVDKLQLQREPGLNAGRVVHFVQRAQVAAQDVV